MTAVAFAPSSRVRAAAERLLRIVAYHESGHAAVAFALGREFTRITIEPANGLAGCVEFPRQSEGRFDHIQAAIIASAGPAAQRRAFPGSRVRAGSAIDRVDVRECLDRFPGSETALRTFIDRESRYLVSLCWPWIEAIAQELLCQPTLTWNQVKAVIDGIETESKGRAAKSPPVNPVIVREIFEENRRRARGMKRSDLAGCVFDNLIERLALGDPMPSEVELIECVDASARLRKLSGDLAVEKLNRVIADRRKTFEFLRSGASP